MNLNLTFITLVYSYESQCLYLYQTNKIAYLNGRVLMIINSCPENEETIRIFSTVALQE